jgi:tetratricopeptide (TPR) repeat protein
MSYKIKYFFSFIFLCAIFFNCNAQRFKGDSLLVSGKYLEASIEYERMIFRSEYPAELNSLKYKKALCYKQLKNFGQALEELQTIYVTNFKDTLFQQVYYQQSLCFYLSQDPSKALWKIDEYLNVSSDTDSYSIFLPLKILCLNETFKWQEAHDCFIKFIQMQKFSSEKSTEMLQIVNELYKKKNLPHIKSIKSAENWSRFIPGAGQIYAERTGEGIANFLINVSILALSAQQALNGFYITGYLAGLGMFNKTYQGGIKRSGILATRINKEQIVHFNSKISEIIRSSLN